jgi:hypothetical protein
MSIWTTVIGLLKLLRSRFTVCAFWLFSQPSPPFSSSYPRLCHLSNLHTPSSQVIFPSRTAFPSHPPFFCSLPLFHTPSSGTPHHTSAPFLAYGFAFMNFPTATILSHSGCY